MERNNANKTLYVAFLAIFFGFGLFLNSFSQTFDIHKEKPFFSSEERYSPYDRIQEDDLVLLSDKLIINFPNLQLAYYTDTNSMDPLIDKYSTGIEIIPESQGDIHRGDIIAYESGKELIVHRVISIEEDDLGWYVIVKGDNSKECDPEKVRFEQIRYVLIGVLY
ncbi:MAG: S26 family signal peptidase [Nanoarchaeota archaeon]|nr:S26 family signal peptidase [Nanoarchaeota archaeon]MCG2718512.1 S26 family signal peptidase [Nanoarchaeota archaeon]